MQRFIHQLRVEQAPPAETAVEARERLGARFPRGATRRMTHLGMLLGATLDGLTLTADDAVVYATTYAETRALEDYLASFPAASPLLFQTSIHPGGIQQVLIGRQQPAARLWPLAGRNRLVEQALLTAVLEPANRVILAGGEERGTWLLEHRLASDRAFAFALLLDHETEGALGSVSLDVPAIGVAAAEPGPAPTLPEWVDALAAHRDVRWQGIDGTWSIEWR